MITVERNGSTWTVSNFSSADCEINKDGEAVATWEAGIYEFHKRKITDHDLGVVIDLVEQFKRSVSK